MKDHLGAATKLLTLGILLDGKGATSAGFPDVLLIIVALGDDSHLIGDEVGRVETDTKLANHGNIGSRSQSLHELLRSGPGNGTQVVDEILLPDELAALTR